MNRKNYLIAVVIMTISLFVSCEGFVEYSGVIYDAETKEPLDSVQCIMVAFKNRGYYTLSDSLGNYHVSTPLVGCVPNCGEYEVEFSKRGYKTQIVKAPNNIILEKE